MTTERWIRRAASPTTAPGTVQDVTPDDATWHHTGLRVLVLAPGESATLDLPRDEALVLPLAGALTVATDHPDQGAAEVVLTGRDDPFAGPTDSLYLPLGSHARLSAPADAAAPSRVALASARATRVLPRRVVAAAQARVDLRGAGSASRRVTNYTLGTDVAIDHLLVCEVVTPGGNWSSYPPHKHDVHSDEPGHEERELEEIYYFEVADGAAHPGAEPRPGVGYHRTYGTAERPIEVLTPVRTGDLALVPHGFHGPCIASPGHDLYYLNVMAGPASDGRWLSTDDPDLAWVRETWPDQDVDPRLTAPAASSNPSPTTRSSKEPA